MPVFRDDRDRVEYLRLLHEEAQQFGLAFQAWCLMTNHVHLVVTPRRTESLARGIGEAHRLYTRMRNFQEQVRGYLFQGRFGSCILDEAHLIRAARYVEMNPVRAGLALRPEQYPWSSAAYHLDLVRSDPLQCDRKVVEISGDWKGFLAAAVEAEEARGLERCLSTGRPWAVESFVRRLEKRMNRPLNPRQGGWPKGRSRKRSN
jgi:putative transposase